MNTIELTKKLISIPSYVDEKNNEKQLADFLWGYLKENLPWMRLEKQVLENDRYNIVAKANGPTNILICGHMDTVEPKQGWQTDQFSGQILNKRLYGLGACDMKGNISSGLKAIESIGEVEGIMLLLYCDEEYDFKGMCQFIKEYRTKINPKFILSLDGAGMEIVNGCRGCLSLDIEIEGKTGHGANPQSGNNAILGFTEVIKRLEQDFGANGPNELGLTTINLAYINGGLNLGTDNEKTLVGRRSNNIPDFAEGSLSIRPSSDKYNALTIRSLMEKYLSEFNLRLSKYDIRNDLKGWLTKRERILFIESILKNNNIAIQYKDLSAFGYLDTQLLWEIYKCDSLCFGAGEKAHSVGENIKIEDLNKLPLVYEKIIKEVL